MMCGRCAGVSARQLYFVGTGHYAVGCVTGLDS